MTEPDRYRSVSGLAVAAAVVGVSSVVSLLSPGLWIVPAVGTAVAVAALREIGRKGSVTVGTIPALVGLGLSVGFGVQAVSRHAVGQRFTESRADSAAEEFVRAIAEGRLADARNMCGPTALPPPGAGGVDAFAAMPAVAALGRCGEVETWNVSRGETPEDLPGCFSRTVRVSCRGPSEAGPFGLAVWVVVERIEPDPRGDRFDRWQVVLHGQAPGG